MTQKLYFYKEELYGRPDVLAHVRDLKRNDPNFTLIDMGASWNPFSTEFLTHTFDINANNIPNIKSFKGDLNDYEDWQQLFDYVKQHGKFSFCNCTHTLEDIAYPLAALKYMPRIAKEGFIAVPSKYWELQRRDLMRGGHHHRWIFDNKNNTLLAYPKINLIEYMSPYQEMDKLIQDNSHLELRIFWKDDIVFEVINGDYLGPTFQDVINMYHGLMP
jgi:hypothetical protein